MLHSMLGARAAGGMREVRRERQGPGCQDKGLVVGLYPETGGQ